MYFIGEAMTNWNWFETFVQQTRMTDINILRTYLRCDSTQRINFLVDDFRTCLTRRMQTFERQMARTAQSKTTTKSGLTVVAQRCDRTILWDLFDLKIPGNHSWHQTTSGELVWCFTKSLFFYMNNTFRRYRTDYGARWWLVVVNQLFHQCLSLAFQQLSCWLVAHYGWSRIWVISICLNEIVERQVCLARRQNRNQDYHQWKNELHCGWHSRSNAFQRASGEEIEKIWDFKCLESRDSRAFSNLMNWSKNWFIKQYKLLSKSMTVFIARKKFLKMHTKKKTETVYMWDWVRLWSCIGSQIAWALVCGL